MICRIYNNEWIEVDLSDIDYEKDEYGGESASFNFAGDAYYVPDYMQDKFTLRFLRRFGITDNFERHFGEVEVADAWDVLEAL